MKEGDKDSVDETEKLKKSVLAILNKLCPQKFDILVEKFNALPIDSQDKMQVIELCIYVFIYLIIYLGICLFNYLFRHLF